NNDYPIHKIAAFNTVASLDAVVLEYKPDFYKMIDKYNHITDGGTMDLYANQESITSATFDNGRGIVVLDNNPDVILYINEDVALLQPDEQTLSNVYVGITLDNSAGEDGADSGHPLFSVEDTIDWHMFSTPLHDAPLGINYTDSNVHDFSYNPNDNPDYPFFDEEEKDGYFPSHTYGKASGEDGYNYNTDWDFYTFEEKHHHWMNFKRNSVSHWDEDPATGHANLQYDNTNESTLVPGKGYLLAIANETFLQSHGTLNDGEITCNVSCTSNPYTVGYNLIGNPYQSYLDFSKFVEKNTTIDSYVILDEDFPGYVTVAAGGSRNTLPEGYDAPGNMIHMHQGFFVHVDEPTVITFNNDMRSADKDSKPSFRGAQHNYPLVNLVVKEENGNREYLTVETNRPSIGGAKKMKGLRAGNSQMFAHAGNADYAILFATEDMNEVPVRFSTEADATYTMIWNTQNGEFTKLQLIDNIAGVTVDMLSSDEYSFTSKATDYESRFRLVFRAIGDDEDDDEAETEDGDFAFFDGSSLVVSGTGILSVCDVNGRVLYCTDVNGTQSSVSMPDMARGLYLLRLTSSESTKVQKIVIRK
ncbi:MAG: T9SS type A sorting domain-containing protein, partial [Bacteroidales bacterium]|nr:T9SS type A sorting domain-containing protein [Bacteroidales bacterium]